MPHILDSYGSADTMRIILNNTNFKRTAKMLKDQFDEKTHLISFEGARDISDQALEGPYPTKLQPTPIV